MIKYPFTINDLMNTDALAKAILMLQEEVKNFVVANTIKYADPIQWNITTQYERNTVVIDPLTGTAYISVQPVPMGISLANTDYWTVVFNLSEFVTRAARNFSLNYEETTTLTATFPTVKGGWLVWNDTLYVANVNITPGDQYVDEEGGNITRITMESIIGNMDDLLTTHKDNMVNIINEVYTTYTTLDAIIGDMSTLDVPDVTTVVAALNVLYTAVNNIAEAIIEISVLIGELADLNTTNKSSIVAAVNEVLNDTNDVDNKVGDLDNLTTADKTSIVAAVNEVLNNTNDVDTKVGELTDLNTVDKSSIVAAINEVFDTPAGTWAMPQWYGAVGDGVTDDSDAFIALFTNEHNIVIPDGEYLLTKQILLQDDTVVICNGKILDRYTPNVNGLFYANNKHNIMLNGINIEGSGYNRGADYSGHAQFYINDCDNIVISKCSVKNTQIAYPIWCFNSTHLTIIDNKINGCAYGCIGLYNDCSDSQILYNTVENFGNTVMDRGYGIVCSGYDTEIPQSRPNNIKCIGNTVINTNEIWEGIESHGCDHIIISDNYVKGCISGITIFKRHISESIVDGCIITNNHIIGVDNCDIAIRVFDHKNGVISGNTIEHFGNRSTGINIYGAIDIRDSENININANILNDVGNNVAADNKLQAVFYVQSSSNIKVCDNECYHCSARYVFYLYDNVKGINIKNNHGIIDYAVRLLREYMSAAPEYNTHNYFIDNVMDGATDLQFTGYIVCSPNYKAISSNTKSGCTGDIMIIQDASPTQNCVYLCTSSKVGATDAVWTPIISLPA